MNLFDHKQALQTSKNLQELLDSLNVAKNDLNDQDYQNLPFNDLPTFGGKKPDNVRAVFSWGETRILVCHFGLWKIEDRKAKENPMQTSTASITGFTDKGRKRLRESMAFSIRNYNDWDHKEAEKMAIDQINQHLGIHGPECDIHIELHQIYTKSGYTETIGFNDDDLIFEKI